MTLLLDQTLETIQELHHHEPNHGFIIPAGRYREAGFATAMAFVMALFEKVEDLIIVSENKATGDLTIQLDNTPEAMEALEQRKGATIQ